MLRPSGSPPRKPPAVDPRKHLDVTTFTGFEGLTIEVQHLYDTLTELGWKVDTEESNLMSGMSKTWHSAGIKVWFYLAGFVCAPPDREVEKIKSITFYRFAPALMPTVTQESKMYEPGDDQQDWYADHREEWDWLIRNGDPQFDTFNLLTAIPFREVPEQILQEAWLEIEEAIDLAEEEAAP